MQQDKKTTACFFINTSYNLILIFLSLSLADIPIWLRGTPLHSMNKDASLTIRKICGQMRLDYILAKRRCSIVEDRIDIV
jgi:hypothetical protein